MASLAPALSRYTFHTQLSHKAGRQTFLALDTHTQEQVIIKVIQPGLGEHSSQEWTDLKLFEREATILKNLSHPAIPSYKADFQTDIDGVWSCVLVQSYLAAPSLASLVAAGKQFSEAEVIAIAKQLLKTLCYLHQQLPPVIHRDIKPSNILLKTDARGSIEQLYLVDFGAVQITSTRDSGTMTIVGSYGYMPLEQFLGNTSHSSDLYSLGMTLIYLLTGKHPAELPQQNGRTVLKGLGMGERMTHWLDLLIQPYPEQRLESADIALRMLNCNKTNAGYFPHLKPVGSKVLVQRDHTELRILTPDTQSGCGIAFIIFVAVFVLSGYIHPVVVITVVLIISLIAFTAWIIVRHCFGSNEKETYSLLSIHRTAGLRNGTAKAISPDHISKIHWRGNSAPFESISLLTYNAGYTFKNYIQASTNQKKKHEITLPPRLSIHAGRTAYHLKQKFTEAELLWLSQELGDFLHLPIQTLHPREAGSDQESSMRQSTQTFRIRPDASHNSSGKSSNAPSNKKDYRHDASDTFDF